MGFYKFIYRPPSGTLSEFLDVYSKKNSPIKFIQVGANDGFIHDPIQKFIKRDNWSGVMLEPQPEVYEGWLKRIHKLRPEVKTVNAALSNTEGKEILYTVSFSSDRWATGLSSFNKNQLIQKIEDGTIENKARKAGVEPPKDKSTWIAEKQINTVTAEKVYEMLDGEDLDLLAIDTEGFDFEILKMFDLSKIMPDVIIYEEEHFDQATKESCKNYLTEHEYVYHQVGRDAYAVKKGLKI
ncbi:FkbM family methyltransferase [Mongoliibacter sp.]|uniref:FkbM family methyltransferase n=1 Tax=Mongoliibacter sp. TaxID=2022438 RepID=UPI0025CCA7C1|nr:FkbM family methyltransferase [Mongoliibacter sp.]